MVEWYFVTEEKAGFFFHSLLFCSNAHFCSANVTLEVIFFNEIELIEYLF